MQIEIRPVDTLFFRDGRPFSMGDESWANGIFPPAPSVIYGALRAAYFSEKNLLHNNRDELDALTQDFRITALSFIFTPAANERQEQLFPLPLDCVKDKNDDDCRELAVMELKDVAPGLQSSYAENLPLRGSHLLMTDRFSQYEQVADGLFSFSQLKKYLEASMPEPFAGKRVARLTTLEPKIGIGREAETHKAAESKLYRIDARRLATRYDADEAGRLSLCVECEGLDDFPRQGLLKLGAEGKSAVYRVAESTDTLSVPPPGLKGRRFKLYMATPACFRKGWYPEWIENPACLAPAFDGEALKLLAAAVGTPISIGGFDIKRGKPKAMRKAVPPGSVYVLEASEQCDLPALIQRVHGKSISEFGDETKEGFGICYVGSINETAECRNP